jgi:AraC-like DNA-binding protein
VKAAPTTECTLWRNEQLFNIDFASYTLSHHSFARHFHDHYVIELVVNGADRFYCDGKTYTAFNDQLVLINPGEVHTGSTVADIPLQYFSFYQIADRLNISINADLNFQQTLINQPLLAEKFLRLYHLFHSGSDAIEECFYDCMQSILQPHTDEKIIAGRKDKRVDELIDFINVNFTQELSLEQLSRLVCLNPFHLSRIFKKATGLSPYEYVLVKRTEYARRLLRKGYKVKEAALEAGFYDASHLNKMFRKTDIPSPKAFRSSKSQYHTISGSVY